MKKIFAAAFLMLSGALLASPAWATCYRITSTNTNSSSNYYTEPGKGTAASWDGATDTSGSAGTLPTVININNSTFQPDGTLLASGIVNFLESGAQSYNSEQILFRCTASEEGQLYEYYATNGDATYAGKNEVGSTKGLPESYQTYATGMALRATNMTTGEYYSRYWKSRPLVNLDRDSLGWILVKAKDFSNTRVELFRLSNSSGGWSSTGIYPQSQPATYIAFQGGGFSPALTVGSDSCSQYSGWYSAWTGAVNLYNRINIRRSATCSVTNVTPTVIFPTISVSELSSGITRQKPVTIRFSCQTGSPANTGVTALVSGVAAKQTAMGILVNPANAAAAVSEGLGTAGSGVSYLLSDNYNTSPNIATGVGIQFTRTNGSALNLLSTLSGSVLGSNAAGWYPVLDDASAGNVVDGVTTYTKTINATFTALPGKTITPGKFTATAQVIIQVQ
ncbi:fimbrial protein [Citrobacter amalonaticus]|uniref:Fimbrial protein n=1 Tax=Citrobacter amalonaticus TaxID=35703 RepID=A0A2S4RS32_CITAM|nr:fimbrial protein [Citrobacter amalonaticus]POT55711.1 fimbrial protein [Citrobacter amalonaticus]POT73924.1 fimbrial protein [Citrobacter amalonaticus]POU62303.1 fimbrial protein [Citrobacter amalonaticus]POV02805.1 fimbrial protein [Citrobacter amalonaticus]